MSYSVLCISAFGLGAGWNAIPSGWCEDSRDPFSWPSLSVCRWLCRAFKCTVNCVNILLIFCRQTHQLPISYSSIYYGFYMFRAFMTIFKPFYRNLKYNQCKIMYYGIPYCLHQNVPKIKMLKIVYIVKYFCRNFCICNKFLLFWIF